MTNRIFSYAFCLITYTSYSQSADIEAIYFNSKDILYKIEKKYEDSAATIYVSHYNNGSVCLKTQTLYSGDTTIVKEETFQGFPEKVKIEQCKDCDDWTISTDIHGDTVWLSGYSYNVALNMSILMKDTILTGESAKQIIDLWDKIHYQRLGLILDNKLPLIPDSLILMETSIAYFLNGIPVKAEIYNPKEQKPHTCISKRYKNRIIYRQYFPGGLKPYKTEKVYWNRDRTYIKWISKRWGRKVISKFQIDGTVLNIRYSDTTLSYIEYLKGTDIFQNIFMEHILYCDPLYHIGLQLFDRKKVLRSISGHGHTTVNKYTFDHQKRITEQVELNDKQEQKKRIKYTYMP